MLPSGICAFSGILNRGSQAGILSSIGVVGRGGRPDKARVSPLGSSLKDGSPCVEI
jgi:hypothetical protein